MIETRRLKNVVIFVQTILSFVLSRRILKWNTDELKKLRQKDQKMHGALHPKSDADRVYLRREMGGRGFINCKGCIRMEENNLG